MMAVLEIEEATNLAHKMVVYIESEQRDLKVDEDKFDALWQSIYDVCSLVHFGILAVSYTHLDVYKRQV